MQVCGTIVRNQWMGGGVEGSRLGELVEVLHQASRLGRPRGGVPMAAAKKKTTTSKAKKKAPAKKKAATKKKK